MPVLLEGDQAPGISVEAFHGGSSGMDWTYRCLTMGHLENFAVVWFSMFNGKKFRSPSQAFYPHLDGKCHRTGRMRRRYILLKKMPKYVIPDV